LIHPAVWPQQTWAENWGLCPFGGAGSSSSSVAGAKFHLDPSNRLATIHQGYRQTGHTDRQNNGPIA